LETSVGTDSAIDKTTVTIGDFLEWQRHDSLILNPPYQRRSVWTSRAKSLLIDSILRNYPIPLIFLTNRIHPTEKKLVREVVDGQQRLRTILGFIDSSCLPDHKPDDDFVVLKSHNSDYPNATYADLPEEVQHRLLQTPLSVNVLPADIGDVRILDIFRRMNTTGTKLNAQELRNANFDGIFKELSYELAYEQYQRWLNWKVFDVQKVAQMMEVELTSDLLGLMLNGVKPKTAKQIDDLYVTYDRGVPDEFVIRQLFRAHMDSLDFVYGENDGPDIPARLRSPAWVYTAFAVASGADQLTMSGGQRPGKSPGNARPVSADKLRDAVVRVKEALRTGEGVDEATLKTLRGATSHRASREMRIQFLRGMVA
jgi:hypothetical protein